MLGTSGTSASKCHYEGGVQLAVERTTKEQVVFLVSPNDKGKVHSVKEVLLYIYHGKPDIK